MRTRVVQPELMDDPGLDPGKLALALRGLRRLNAVSVSAPSLSRILFHDAGRSKSPLRVLDVACASGDWAVGMSVRAARLGIPLHVEGCDVNEGSLALARQQAERRGATCTFFHHDAVREPFPGEYDCVVTSLFLHHLSDEDAATVLRRMAACSRQTVIVNDLVRSRTTLAMVAIASRVLSRSPVVHTDALRSVRAAFTRSELLALAERAGLRPASLTFGGFGRVCLVHRREHGH